MIIHAKPRAIQIELDHHAEMEEKIIEILTSNPDFMKYLSDLVEIKALEEHLMMYETSNWIKPVPDVVDVIFKLRFYTDK